MGMNSPQNSLIKPVGMAVSAAAVAAIATMFVPVAMLESFTGSTGISEMIPATAAPLGDTARAIMAFLMGAITMTIAMVLLLRPARVSQDTSVAADLPDAVMQDESKVSGRLQGLKSRASAKLSMPKMPWVRDDADILNLADLPKLRAFDAHPDAPARRPLSASSDLAEPLAQIMQPAEEPVMIEHPVEDIETAEPVSDPVIVEKPVVSVQPVIVEEPAMLEEAVPYAAPISVATPVEASPEPSLADMVAQLEAAVIQRKAQLAELEIVAAKLAEDNGASVSAEEIEPVAQDPIASEILPPEAPRPVLEAVPSSPHAQSSNAGEQEMDAALNAALETLQRMNSRAG